MGQHFVPQHYLRQFRLDSKRIVAARVAPFGWIGPASIKGQCQRGEFYGTGGLDGIYKEIEACVAPALRDVASARAWNRDQQFAIRMLAVSLHSRTQKAIEASLVPYRKLADEQLRFAIDRGDLPAPPGGWRPGIINVKGIPAGLMLSTIACDLEAATLRMKLLAAPAGHSFITSDNPAVATNPFGYATDRNRPRVGFAQAGFQLLLPLSPGTAVIFYDQKVYKIGGPNETNVAITPEDVELLNSLQVQSADTCLFTHTEAMRAELERLYTKYERFRPNVSDTVQRYEITGPKKEIFFHGKHFSVRTPRPLACIRYRRRISVQVGQRRDPGHSDLVSALMADIDRNPKGGDIDARMRRLFGADVLDN